MDLNELNNFTKSSFTWQMSMNSFKFIRILYFKIIISASKINIHLQSYLLPPQEIDDVLCIICGSGINTQKFFACQIYQLQ